MGMYAEVYGREIKLTGLLATVILDHARSGALPDVELANGLLDCIATVSRKEVENIVAPAMRAALLNGHAHKATGWYQSMHPGEYPLPLCNLQDIMRYSTDVTNFEWLCLWLHYTREESITWA